MPSFLGVPGALRQGERPVFRVGDLSVPHILIDGSDSMGTRYSQSEPPTARYGARLRLEAEAATAASALMLLLEIAVSFAALK